MPLPVIRTQRLVLRPWTLDDTDELHELWTLPEVRQFLWDDVVIAREAVDEIVAFHLATAERHGIGSWTLHAEVQHHTPAARIAGFCGFRFIDAGPEIELMYGLRGEHWGKGLATEACGAVLGYLWRSTNFQQVHARTDPPNKTSIGVIERLGMTHVSTSESTIKYVLHRAG